MRKKAFLCISFVALLAAGTYGVMFPEYFPLDPAVHGVKTFEWTFGRTGSYQSYIEGSHTVPYTSGSIEGTGIVNHSDITQLYATNDGSEVKWIAFAFDTKFGYISTDSILTSHPSSWTFSTVTDDMLFDQGTYYFVDPNLTSYEMDNDQALLFDIQDVNVPAGQYNDSVIIWFIDEEYPFRALDFGGKEVGLGITLPTGTQTQGDSVTHFDVYAYGIGLIANGDIDAETGELLDLAVLVDQSFAVSISGKVIDSLTGEPIGGVGVEFWNEETDSGDEMISDENGCFILEQVPPGVGDLGLDPTVASGYARIDDSLFLALEDGQVVANRYVALRKGTKVKGRVLYPDGTPANGWDIIAEGNIFRSECPVDESGNYEIILAPDDYLIYSGATYDREAGGIQQHLIVSQSDVGNTVIEPNLVVYDATHGQNISGTIQVSSQMPEVLLSVMVYESSYAPAPGSSYIDSAFYSRCVMASEELGAGAFSLDFLPQGNYDLFLTIESAGDDYMGGTIVDRVSNVQAGSANVILTYDSQGTEANGQVVDHFGYPVLFAEVVLRDTITHKLAGWGYADQQGYFSVKYLPTGSYDVVVQKRWHDPSTKIITVPDNPESSIDMGVFSLRRQAIKEGPDLSGDGCVSLADFTLIAGNWLLDDYPYADFNMDDIVDIADLSRFVELWLWKAMWNTQDNCSINSNIISDHVFYIDIVMEWDYDIPDDGLMSHDFELDVSTDNTVASVEFVTPVGNTFAIPALSEQCDGEVCTFFEPDGEGKIKWTYYGRFSSESSLDSYGDGHYTIIVHYLDGTEDQTIVWYGVPGTDNPILQPIIQPIMISPVHNSSVSSPVTFTWQACLDANATGIDIDGENETNGDEVWFSLPVDSVRWENVVMSSGEWGTALSFENRFFVPDNGDGIPVECSKCSTTDYFFTVD